MTAKDRYARYQRHLTSVSSSWAQLSQEQRDAWEGLNDEIEHERAEAMERAARRRFEAPAS